MIKNVLNIKGNVTINISIKAVKRVMYYSICGK